MKTLRTLARMGALLGVVLALSCGGAIQAKPVSPAEQARKEGPTSPDPEVVGRWLLTELISPASDAKRAEEARRRLAHLGGKGMVASLARGVDAEAHGHPRLAAGAYLELVRAARTSSDPMAPLAAWYASNRLLQLRSASRNLWTQASPIVEAAMKEPGSLGWRARGELVEWWAREAYRQAQKNLLDTIADHHGCGRELRLAGPFGRAIPSDRWKAFDAEKPGRWPLRFAPDPFRSDVVPAVLPTERRGCEVSASEPTEEGIFYAETFFELDAATDVLVAVQGARAVLVDDKMVLDRDPRVWGNWPTFGAAVHLGPGRHRVVARLEQAATSIRFQRRDGTPLRVKTSKDPAPGYTLTPPKMLGDPNVINRYLRNGDVVAPGDDITAFLAAYLAHVEGQDDVGSVLMEPLVARMEAAAPVALAQQALLVANDPAFPEGSSRDLARELHNAVLEKDPGIWRSRHWITVDGARKRGLPLVARELRALYDAYPEVVGVGRQLLSVYDELGWSVEKGILIRDMAERFPNDEQVQADLVGVLESVGQLEQADRVAARVRELDPESSIELDRALARRDYAKAIAELRRLAKLRPDRKAITDRIDAVMRSAGMTRESFDQLERALRDNPRSASDRLALADARLASGDHAALRKAVADAIEAGADTTDLENAIELLEGRTELEPYRIDGKAVVAEFEKSGGQMDAAAVRILDYGVTWVHGDGSSRLLEHELIRVQSQEAISKMTEQRVPRGLLLTVRVIKKDGTVLEPEFVADKPTLTMPHLEIGDYLETEWITAMASDGHGGASYIGPHWFFREADIGYWRSEFVVVSPTHRPLTVETSGVVPAPKVEERGPMTVRRWRVDKSPAAFIEPGTVPVRELLPNIRVGWGISLQDRLRNLADSFADQSIPDPRLRRIAQRIVKGIPKSQPEERARRLYRWILANIEKGNERDGRRIVIGRSGDLGFCFLYLTQLLDIPTDIAVVRNGLAQPPIGPISEAETFASFLIRVRTEHGERWLTVRDRFTPYGYIPAQLRGQPGFILSNDLPKVTTSTTGSFDGVVYEGTGALRPTGSAALDLSRRFVGKYAIGLRESIERVPEAQLRDAVESQLLSADLPGASLVKLDVQDRDDLDKPLTLRMKIEAPDFARRGSGVLVLSPPFNATLGNLATLPERKTTMLLAEASRIEVRLRITLPDNARVSTPLQQVDLRDGDRVVVVRDRLEGKDLVLDRVFDLPAARIRPDQYAAFQAFARAADEAAQREIRIELR